MWVREHDYDAVINATSERYDVPVALIQAIIGAESGFKANALLPESTGEASRGLMQLLPSTARALGYVGTDAGLDDPIVNIDLGTRLLRDNLKRAGNSVERAVSAYNGGWGNLTGNGPWKGPGSTTFCLQWTDKAKGICKTGKRVTVQPGQFGNQAYVDKVIAAKDYFERTAPKYNYQASAIPSATKIDAALSTNVGIGFLLLLLGAGAVWLVGQR